MLCGKCFVVESCISQSVFRMKHLSIHNPEECQKKLSQNDEYINKKTTTTTHTHTNSNKHQTNERSLEQDHNEIKKI